MKNLRNAKMNGASSTEKKQLHIVSYATELMYDLMISPSKNVAESPGFEAVLGLLVGVWQDAHRYCELSNLTLLILLIYIKTI